MRRGKLTSSLAGLLLACACMCSATLFDPSGDVQITTMQDCVAPSFVTDKMCVHNPTGNDAYTLSCGGGNATQWSWPGTSCPGQTNVVAAVTLHASGTKNSFLPADLTVYTKANSRKVVSESQTGGGTTVKFVPEEKISVSMSPVTAYAQLHVDSRADPRMQTPEFGRDGVFSWDYEMYTTNYIPDKHCNYKSTSDECCNPYRYPCGNSSSQQEEEAGFVLNTTVGGVGENVYKSCKNSLCSQHFGTAVDGWYPSPQCAAALSPDGSSDTCWHNICPGQFSGATLAKYIARGKCGNGWDKFWDNIGDRFIHSKLFKDNNCTDKGILAEYEDHAEAVTQCKWPNGDTISKGPVDVSLVGSKTINKLGGTYLVQDHATAAFVEGVAMGWIADGLTNPGHYATKHWVRGWNGVVYQTRTTKCGQVHEIRDEAFHYTTDVTVKAENKFGSFSKTVTIDSAGLPTEWMYADECQGSNGAIDPANPGCFRFKIVSWNTADGALNIEEVKRGRFWLSYPWSATGDVNNVANKTWANPWEDAKSDKSWMYSGGMTNGAMFTPASLHGADSRYTGKEHNANQNFVCTATPMERNATMLSIPGNNEAFSTLHAGAKRNANFTHAASKFKVPPVSSSISFSARAQSALGSVGGQGDALNDRDLSQANFVNMRLQNAQESEPPKIVGNSSNVGGSGQTGPYMPFYRVSDTPKQEGSTTQERPFYWIDGNKKFYAQAYTTESEVTILLQFPEGNIVREQTTACDSATLEWQACSSVRTTGSGGSVLRVTNTGQGWCMFWLEMTCSGGVVPKTAPEVSLAAGNSTLVNYDVFSATVGEFSCTVDMKNNMEQTIASAAGNCSVVNYNRQTESAGIGVIPSCGVDCPLVGKNKTGHPTFPQFWFWYLLGGLVGTFAVGMGIYYFYANKKDQLEDKKKV